MTDNPSALPGKGSVFDGSLGPFGQRVDVDHPGMTLRDWFAGQAVAQIFGAALVRDDETPPSSSKMAVAAYTLADAMLAARQSTR